MPGRAQYDGAPIAIIGNGPVGQTTSLLLARWGIPTVVLDSRDSRDLVGSKAICQQRDVLDIWGSVGVGRQVADEGVTWTVARTFHRDRELFSIEFADRGRSAYPAWVNISQSRTEQILDERIAASPLIDVRWGHDVAAIAEDGTSIVVTARTRENVETVRAPYAVVCGGARAYPLRAMLGVEFEGRTFDDYFLICDIKTDLPEWAKERRFYFDPEWNPGRQVLVHPCPDSTFRVDWQVPPHFDLSAEERDGGLDRRIRQIIGERPYEIVWRSVYRFQSRHTNRFRVGRALLAGDCAHLLAPFGARGLNSGVQDAENAAWKIAAILGGWGDQSLLESYHDERMAAALENLEITTHTMDFLVPQSDAGWAHRRDVLARAEHDMVARRQVDSGRLAEPFWYVDSPLITPSLDRPFPGRPAKGSPAEPGPGVLIPDVPVHIDGDPAARTRDVGRDGILVLTTDGVDRDATERVAARATSAPLKVYAVADIEVDGLLSECLDTGPNEAWVVRPDGHVAAVVAGDDDIALHAAIRRTLGFSTLVDDSTASPV
ncbi:pentachlorophenol monooxygenase/3-(3-hydroxy-phenyl)propionate hydroxylase [Antricoccus suffuscus]|uniref:Pentachlorophenol monooxygenase/3-(3-hydroxy-phenyl)propionate hydroxylase n=1 Tax=Antricoccus suffuscus TaxID=1629062 RepID=A0A2T1A2P9_9ACTN|nr:FAD-dependent monooxygenase [Antricoccus suffuscus]PRZ42866.1 pentachlorophenol monooxygenase/3-(3-hydroxy-phenyl)propionate hydroxylase [Antricoccus suffuscus]